MTNLIKGKGIYIWQIKRCGPVEQIIETVDSAGMTHIMPKIADGNYEYIGNTPYLSELISRAHTKGIKVIPFQFVYGAYPESEADRIIIELRKYPYDGLVINAESAYRDLTDPDSAATRYGAKLRKYFPDLPLYLSTFRYPSYHREFPFHTFLQYCDAAMPQVYWMQANGTVPYQLKRTLEEYASIDSNIPIIPTGAAFGEHGWAATPEDQKIFVDEVKTHKLTGCNWWEYYETFIRFPALGKAIIDSPFEVEDDEPPVIIPPAEDAIFRAECIWPELNVRATPEYPDGVYVRSLFEGDRVYVYEELFNDGINWFRIGQMEWCSGHEKYMEKLEEPVEPPQELTDKEKLEILWEREFPNGYKD